MPLTALQRTVLERYRTFRESPPTVWRLMALAFRNYALLFIGVTLGCISLYMVESVSAGWFLAGIGAGAVLRDFGSSRLAVRIWPTIACVLDWQKIDDLLAGQEFDETPQSIP